MASENQPLPLYFAHYNTLSTLCWCPAIGCNRTDEDSPADSAGDKAFCIIKFILLGLFGTVVYLLD